MKTLQSSYTVPGLFVLLLSAVLLSLASCGGGGGGGGSSNGGGSAAIKVSAISAGNSHTCAILSTGAAQCWGNNATGQLGNNSTAESNLPVAVVQTPADTSDSDKHTSAVLLDSGVTAISARGLHTCAIHNGAAKCWGFNGNGRLGTASSTDTKIPHQVLGELDSDATTSAISAGGQHTCAIHGGAAFCWGNMLSGRLGNNMVADAFSDFPVAVLLKAAVTTDPTEPAKFMDGDVDAIISAGESYTCAVHLEKAYCWGYNGSGQLGNDTTDNKSLATLVSVDSGVMINISAGLQHTCAIHRTTAGGVNKDAAYCWGSNSHGQLGNGVTRGNQSAPVEVGGELGDLVTDISAGASHTCAVQDGKAWCWGNNSQGQLGRVLGVSPMVSATPVAVDPSGDGRGQLSGVNKISAGQFHTCALLNTGVVQCWGGNGNGQLGVGSKPAGSTSTPQTVREP